MALIIDGKTLTYALEDDIRLTFLELAMLCKAVVCCRVSPLQKALVVKLVKENVAGCVTMAIGDGANDVSMIQAAHIGVGISGQEGLQAARSADFAIAQFRFLRKLMLVHGGWAYSRVSKVIIICFYKNITLYLIQFWFSLNNNFSGMTLFETWSQVSSYNVVWTLLPPIVIGMFDQYVSARVLDKYPQMYRLGQSDTFYNHKVFLGWIFNSFFHSLCLFYFWAYSNGDGDILANGLTNDNWSFGTMVYITTLLTVLLKHCLIIDSFVGLTTFAFVGSIAGFMLLLPIYIIVGPLVKFSPELFNLNNAVFWTPNFWLALLVFPILINVRDFTWK
jgi:phospholipid-transporting ATPase